MGLDQGRVTLVVFGVELGEEGVDCKDVGGVEGSCEEEAGGVVESNEDGGGGTLVALGEVKSKFIEEEVLVSDLCDEISWY